jgi:16S rRNA (cytosine967-C5)-methyltransferase
MKIFGGRKTENLLKFNNERPITYLRRNASAVSKGAFEADIAHVSPRSPQATGFKDLYYELKPQVLPTDIMSFGAGMCSVQAPSSGWVVALLNPEKSDIILDVSAAPGGKTTLIADLLDDKGAVVACDSRYKRAELIVDNIKRTRTIDKIYTVVSDGTMPPFTRKFDKVLLDAPCTGTGVIQRHPDSRWMRKPSDITNAVKLQRELLLKSASLVEVGGVLVYSTCSLEAEENWEQVEWFLENNPKFQLDNAKEFVDDKYVDINGCLSITPYDNKMDGMFGARLKRIKG